MLHHYDLATLPIQNQLAHHTTYTPCVVTSTVTTSTNLPVLTVTSTSTSITTSTSTTTVPASSGFLPIQSTLPGSTYDGNEGTSPVQRRGSSKQRGSPGKLTPWKKSYPKGVTCKNWQPSPICQTVSVTSTSTIVPSATSTTSTTTASTVTATQTVYAACATNNFASQYQGVNIYFAGAQGGTTSYNDIITTADTDIYSCCVTAITDVVGLIWGFGGAGQCQIPEANAGTCASQSQNQWETSSESGATVFPVGNAYCGEVNQNTLTGGAPGSS